MERRALRRFFKYSALGACAFLFDLLLLFLLIDVVQVPYLYAAGTAFFVATSIHYLSSRHFVFVGTTRAPHVGYAYFILIATTGIGLVTGLMYLLVEYAQFSPIVARVSVAGFTGMWGYLVNLYFNFKVSGKHDLESE